MSAVSEPVANALTVWAARGEAGTRSEEFAARVAQDGRRVFRIACSVLGNRADAEEVAQDAFLQAYRRWSSLRDPERFRAWVGRITFRLALNRRRSRARQSARETAWQAQQPLAVSGGEGLRHLHREIERLPEKLRTTLLLSAVEGMTSAEVASVLEIPAATVRSRLYLARKKLLEGMER